MSQLATRKPAAKPYCDCALFRRPTAVRQLLRARLPPLPPVMHLYFDAPAVGIVPLNHEEEQQRFLQYNAARREHHRTGRASWARRARHLEEFLCRMNFPLIPFALHKYRQRAPAIVADADEAFSAGANGLLRAVQKFDATRGFAFSTYATRVLYNGWTTYALGKLAQQSKLSPRKLTDDLHAAPQVDVYSDERAALHAELIQNRAGLTPAEHRAVALRYLGREFGAYQCIADEFGCSRECARLIEKRAIAKLRAVLLPADANLLVAASPSPE